MKIKQTCLHTYDKVQLQIEQNLNKKYFLNDNFLIFFFTFLTLGNNYFYDSFIQKLEGLILDILN